MAGRSPDGLFRRTGRGCFLVESPSVQLSDLFRPLITPSASFPTRKQIAKNRPMSPSRWQKDGKR